MPGGSQQTSYRSAHIPPRININMQIYWQGAHCECMLFSDVCMSLQLYLEPTLTTRCVFHYGWEGGSWKALCRCCKKIFCGNYIVTWFLSHNSKQKDTEHTHTMKIRADVEGLGGVRIVHPPVRHYKSVSLLLSFKSGCQGPQRPLPRSGVCRRGCCLYKHKNKAVRRAKTPRKEEQEAAASFR